ncbi:hypothetical protein Tco_0439992 [Tanacetum coccineum]
MLLSATVDWVDDAEGTTIDDDSIEANGNKINQLNRHLAPKYHPPHVQPPASTNTLAALSDEELALLLHQELNNSPRVPRVPRMRTAGSLPQLNSITSTSHLGNAGLAYDGNKSALTAGPLPFENK